MNSGRLRDVLEKIIPIVCELLFGNGIIFLWDANASQQLL